jgi:hypothetical protein
MPRSHDEKGEFVQQQIESLSSLLEWATFVGHWIRCFHCKSIKFVDRRYINMWHVVT